MKVMPTAWTSGAEGAVCGVMRFVFIGAVPVVVSCVNSRDRTARDKRQVLTVRLS
jgi:hypothetical protein